MFIHFYSYLYYYWYFQNPSYSFISPILIHCFRCTFDGCDIIVRPRSISHHQLLSIQKRKDNSRQIWVFCSFYSEGWQLPITISSILIINNFFSFTHDYFLTFHQLTGFNSTISLSLLICLISRIHSHFNP